MLLENERIKLRALEPEDLDYLYRWENDAEQWATGNTIAPYSRYSLKQYIAAAESIYESRQLYLMIVLKATGQPVGIAEFHDFEPHHRRAEVGMMLDASARRQGIGCDALTLMCRYAFSFLKIHHLYGFVPVKNVVSIGMLEHCGFREYGRIPDWFIAEGEYEEVKMMGIMDKDMP